MKTLLLVLSGLLGLAALLLALPGAVLAGAELLYSRNQEWGPLLLVAHSGAAICALFWGIPLLAHGRTGHWGWLAGYVVAFAVGLVALENMYFKFMM